MNRPHGKQRIKQKPKNAKNTFFRLMSYIRKYYLVHFILVIVFIFAAAYCSVQGTLFLRTFLDDYVVPFIGTGSFDEPGLLKAILGVCVIYLLYALFAYAWNRLMVTVSNGILNKIRQEMFNHLQTLPLRYFDNNTHGELMSRFTNDTDTLRQLLSQTIPQFISSIVTIVSVALSMIMLSWQLFIITVVMLIVTVNISGRIATRSGKYFAQQQKELGKANGYIEEMIEGQKVVKVFCREEKCSQEFRELNNSLCDAATRAVGLSNIMGPVSNNLGHAVYAITAMLGCLFSIMGIGSMTLGSIASYLQFTKQFNQPINQIMQQFANVISALAGAERIFEVMDEESEVDKGKVTLVRCQKMDDGTLAECDEYTGHWAWKHPHDEGFELVELKGDVQFHDVDFSYVENKQVLYDINMYAHPGEKLAFVGATGAGKTTITNLINRFYDIQKGQITYDGIDIKLIKKADLRRSLSIVLQDTHLFTGTVADNIRYGKLDATMDEVVAAAKLANADYFIRHLPQGYDTVLTNDGASLSQGQRQLLAIARAAIANPPVLILDEATSSIDTHTEAIVQEGMDKLMEGRTVFVIAHRLSTVRNSDCIMVLDHGEIIERGSHDDLIAKQGRYYQLYTGAFELD
ncbi:MAG: ABC transporter ATP-binding protein [Erysipelotrichaceae bacterium]|nr:ABC transporter ATP-binding protein [Erysipelotrichaceae bacterium]